MQQLAAALLAVAMSVAPCGAARASESVPLYFGNGCFWGRQKDYVDTERKALGRAPEQVTAVVGYAGGKKTGAPGSSSPFAPAFDTLRALNDPVEDVSLPVAVLAGTNMGLRQRVPKTGVLTAAGVQGGMGRCVTFMARQTVSTSAWVRTSALSGRMICHVKAKARSCSCCIFCTTIMVSYALCCSYWFSQPYCAQGAAVRDMAITWNAPDEV